MFFAAMFPSLAMAQSQPAQSQPASRPKYGPAGAPRAVTLALDHTYLQNPAHPAPDYWALAGYYVPQAGAAACSAASIAMVLNAARSTLPKNADTPLVTQAALVEGVKVECWAERLSAAGCQGHHGTPLDVLARIVRAAFVQNGFPHVSVRVVHVADRSPDVLRALVADLRANERTARDFILANFDQKAFTDDTSAGHIAPLAAFDAEHVRVLIMDPDREWYEPYWVSVDTLLAGLATRDSETGEARGYLIVEP
jgi:hypothetical protein